MHFSPKFLNTMHKFSQGFSRSKYPFFSRTWHQLMSSQSKRIIEAACYALSGFVQNLEEEDILPYLDTLMGRLGNLLQIVPSIFTFLFVSFLEKREGHGDGTHCSFCRSSCRKKAICTLCEGNNFSPLFSSFLKAVLEHVAPLCSITDLDQAGTVISPDLFSLKYQNFEAERLNVAETLEFQSGKKIFVRSSNIFGKEQSRLSCYFHQAALIFLRGCQWVLISSEPLLIHSLQIYLRC